MKQTKTISGFPGVGKSFLAESTDLVVLDSDSSAFSWIREGERHPNFPENYMEHIEKNIGKVDYILVSSHDVVREALASKGFGYTLVYPALEEKKVYLKRYTDRGNNDGFISFISSKWDDFISDIEKENHPKLLKLTNGQFMADVLDSI